MDENIKDEKGKIVVLLGCGGSKGHNIMDCRWNVSFPVVDDDTVFIVSGLTDECEYYEEIIGGDYRVYYDIANDTFSNAQGVARIIRENDLGDYVIYCRLSPCHMWRFKKCLKMVGLNNNDKMDLESSKRIPEARNEWMAVIIYSFGRLGIRISNLITKHRGR